MLSLIVFRGMPLIERIHPLQGGYVRRRVRRTRRPGSPRESAPLFYLWHWSNTVTKLAKLGLLLWQVDRIRRRVQAEHVVTPYSDIAIECPIPDAKREPQIRQERPALEAAR